jgi:hypothetical protein
MCIIILTYYIKHLYSANTTTSKSRNLTPRKTPATAAPKRGKAAKSLFNWPANRILLLSKLSGLLSSSTDLKRVLESGADVDTLVTMVTQLTAQLLGEGDAIKSVDFRRGVYGVWGVCIDDYGHGDGKEGG